MGLPVETRNDPASEMHARLRQLVAKLDDSKPRAGLLPNQQKFLTASLLASIITADDRIASEELSQYATLLTNKLLLPEYAIETMADIITHGLDKSELDLAADKLRQSVPIENRIALINMLWSVAFSDNELHPNEETQIHQIAEMIGVHGLRALAEKLTVLSERIEALSKPEG